MLFKNPRQNSPSIFLNFDPKKKYFKAKLFYPQIFFVDDQDT